jgi:hypothetical protein
MSVFQSPSLKIAKRSRLDSPSIITRISLQEASTPPVDTFTPVTLPSSPTIWKSTASREDGTQTDECSEQYQYLQNLQQQITEKDRQVTALEQVIIMCLKSKLTTATGAKTINPRNSDSYT